MLLPVTVTPWPMVMWQPEEDLLVSMAEFASSLEMISWPPPFAELSATVKLLPLPLIWKAEILLVYV